MILTITLNPSLDYIYLTDTLQLNALNKVAAPTKSIGGKGINTSRTCATLGAEVISTGFLGGDTGKLVAKILEKETFQRDYLPIDGETRNAITVMHDNDDHTEIVEAGVYVTAEKEAEIIAKAIQIYQANPAIRVICLGGSANTDNHAIYTNILHSLEQIVSPDVCVLADISGPFLTHALHHTPLPYFIKPNILEFSQLIGQTLTTKHEVAAALRENHFDMPFVMVSCGKDGAVVYYQDKIYDLSVPVINLVNPTGSGDATVGGIAYGLDHDLPLEEMLRLAMACGVSNALHEETGFVTIPEVEELMPQIGIKQL